MGVGTVDHELIFELNLMMRADSNLDVRVLWCEGPKVHPETQFKGFTGCWVQVIYPLVNIKPF